MAKLTALGVKKAGPGVYSDGLGLILRVKETGARSWILRVQVNGNRRDIGLGSDADLTLTEAREKAAMLRKIARRGGDPIAERDKDKLAIPTFGEAVQIAYDELGKGWHIKTATQFKSSLEQHAIPVIGRRRVDQIEAAHVISVLSPIWTEKPQIARKVRHRIGQVLSFCKSRGWRTNPVPDPAEIRAGLAKQPSSKGFAYMDYKLVPALFVEELAKQESPARLALLFTILTGARSGETRKAHWGQIDAEARTWHREAEIMSKTGNAHTVTLNEAALAILSRAEALFGRDGLIFPSMRGKVLSDAAMGKMMKNAGRTETVHGFRKSFRNWAAERMPHIPFAVAEMAIAHTVGTNVEKVYLTSDLQEQRFALTDAWGEYVAPSLSSARRGGAK
ncbi:site-specific integrase [Pontixanthobacter gangjinensis]|uniref:Integrase arm-type DNA-binding domain-containing protein n=1 Tax=Pontixanthobacter gangjinensis TaxID=1028742 RepID=A0A6I4SQ41_9SPHN|nr:site-specific integrase [Pontixanthobacter gangjinensis]MXO57186.1 integrase arm-type DNA-binding domain-containing protein [Pontixanthobacter gangjinensis]